MSSFQLLWLVAVIHIFFSSFVDLASGIWFSHPADLYIAFLILQNKCRNEVTFVIGGLSAHKRKYSRQFHRRIQRGHWGPQAPFSLGKFGL